MATLAVAEFTVEIVAPGIHGAVFYGQAVESAFGNGADTTRQANHRYRRTASYESTIADLAVSVGPPGHGRISTRALTTDTGDGDDEERERRD